MSSKDQARQMTVDELVDTLQTLSGPLLAELVQRGYEVRLDARNSASGVPIFVAARKPRLAAE